MFFFFFFQAEDGIRDGTVTGVQTCALPICAGLRRGASVTDVAAGLNVTRGTGCKWRGRFLPDRLEGLTDAPWPGTPRTIADEQVDLGHRQDADRARARPGHALPQAS